MPRNRELHEIDRNRFWKLEDYLNTAEGQEKFGPVEVTYIGDAKIYRSGGRMILSSQGGYFAHHSLETAASGG